jgi:hypothetical protein
MEELVVALFPQHRVFDERERREVRRLGSSPKR